MHGAVCMMTRASAAHAYQRAGLRAAQEGVRALVRRRPTARAVPSTPCGTSETPPARVLYALANEAGPRMCHTQTETRAAMAHTRTTAASATVDAQARQPCTVQRLEVLVAVMLARERRIIADREDGGCTALAAALATLPSGLLEIVADAVAALGHADAQGAPRRSA